MIQTLRRGVFTTTPIAFLILPVVLRQPAPVVVPAPPVVQPQPVVPAAVPDTGRFVMVGRPDAAVVSGVVVVRRDRLRPLTPQPPITRPTSGETPRRPGTLTPGGEYP